MRKTLIGALLCALFATWPVAAQEQRGSVEGVVKDAQGAVLPGVTVEARHIERGTTLSVVTDGAGVYRFPSLPAGTYEVTAQLTGFQTSKVENVPLALGQIKTVTFTLQLAGVTESVQVSAEAPLVDTRQSSRATSIRAEQVELLPRGRDFTTLVTQAAGVNNESTKLGGISIDGASAGENRFIIDGIETTNLQTGVSGKSVISDFVEEVQVKSSGYTAEYGGATGGVINVLTKSGTNNFRGNALFNWQSDKLEGGNRPTLRRGVLNNAIAEYVTYPEDDYSRVEPGFALGGPVARDRAWFFAAYQPALVSTTRTANAQTSQNPNASIWENVEQKDTQHYLTANATAQMSDKIRTRVAYNNSWRKTEGRLPAQSGTTSQLALLSIDEIRPNWSISGNVDWVASPKMYFGAKAGYYFSDYFQEGVPDEVRYLYSRGNVGQAGVPAAFQHAANFSNVFTNNASAFDQQTRLFFQADGTFYVNLGGQHTFKAGLQLDDVGNKVLRGEQQNLVRLQWGSSLSGLSGPYGYYQVRSNGVEPKKGLITEGDVSTTNIGLFFQDAWTINNRLTINAGVRTERERVPFYAAGPDLPEFGLDFGFGDKLAPRLGFAYDIKGDGRWKAYGSWGIFYDIFKLELPRGSFGGDKWLEYYYTLDTYDYNTLVSNASCPPACSGTLIRGPVDFRHPSTPPDGVDPDLKPMKMQEAAFGFEHQLSSVAALGVRYVHKQVDKAIEDTGALDAQQNEIYTIANPGFGDASVAFAGVPYPKAVRDYDSVEFTMNKRFSSNWSAFVSYMWSRLYGNYSGLSQSDENGRTSPNVGRAFDYPLMMFNGSGEPEYGLLGTDRPHQFKVNGIYAFSFGTSVGADLYMASGIPVTREIAVIPPNNFPVQYMGRVSDGRMPMYSQTNLFVQHEFRMGDSRRLQLSFNVLNLFNQDTATNRNITYQDANGITFDEAAFYAGNVNFEQEIARQRIVQSPLFLKDSGFQAPIAARFGVKFIF